MTFDPFGGDILGFTIVTVVASLLIPVVITILVIGTVIWAIRRNAPRAEDPAIAELRARLARGEIDPTEFEVRLRSLRGRG